MDARTALNRLKQLGPFGVASAMAMTLPPLGSIVLFANIDTVANFLRSNQTSGVAIYVLVFGITGGFALMPTYAGSALCGWAFGFGIGYAAVMTSIILAALIGYTVGRLTSKHRVVEMLESNVKSRAVYDALLRGSPLKTTWIVTLLRLPPNSPFAVTNLLMAGAKVSPIPFIVGTIAGMAPRTAVICWLASKVQSERFELFKDPTAFVVGIAAMLVVLALIGSMAKRALDRATVPSDQSTEKY